LAETSKSSEEVVFVIVAEETSEGILAAEEISKDVLCSFKRKASMIEATESPE